MLKRKGIYNDSDFEVINNNVVDIEQSTTRIKEKTYTGTELANTIKERAVELEEDTLKADSIVRDLQEETIA